MIPTRSNSNKSKSIKSNRLRADAISASIFMTALRDCSSTRSWEECIELLGAWLRVGRGVDELTPRMLYVKTALFDYFYLCVS